MAVKSIVTTLAFCGPRVLEAGLKSFRATQITNSPHYLLHNHYPMPDNEHKLRDVAERHGLNFFDSEFDRGAAQSLNNFMDKFGWDNTDYIIGIDPDANPDTVGWDKACIDVMDADPSIGWTTLSCIPIKHNIEHNILPGERQNIGGHNVFFAIRVDMINVTVWRSSFLKSIGGLQQQHRYYGQVEAPTHAALLGKQMRFCYMLDYTEGEGHGQFHEETYARWKREHIAGFSGSFAEWLNQFG